MSKLFTVGADRKLVDRTPVSAGAQVATLTKPGIVMPGRALSVTNTGVLNAELATSGAVGVVRPGDGLEVDVNGVLRTTLKAATQHMTFYVRKTGSDDNDGLTPDTAFLTIRRAITEVYAWFFGEYNCLVDIGAGSWTETNDYSFLRASSARAVEIRGAGVGSTTIGQFRVVDGGHYIVKDLTVTSLAGAQGILAADNATVDIDGNVTVQMVANSQAAVIAANGGILICRAGSTVRLNIPSSNGAIHAYYNGIINMSPTATKCNIIVNGSVTNATAIANSGGIIVAGTAGTTLSGTVTGSRYNANTNGVIYTVGAGENFFPGTTAGGVARGGQYY